MGKYITIARRQIFKKKPKFGVMCIKLGAPQAVLSPSQASHFHGAVFRLVLPLDLLTPEFTARFFDESGIGVMRA